MTAWRFVRYWLYIGHRWLGIFACLLPRELRLEMLLDEPVYRVIDWDGARATVSARSGERVGATEPEQAVTIASNAIVSCCSCTVTVYVACACVKFASAAFVAVTVTEPTAMPVASPDVALTVSTLVFEL